MEEADSHLLTRCAEIHVAANELGVRLLVLDMRIIVGLTLIATNTLVLRTSDVRVHSGRVL